MRARVVAVLFAALLPFVSPAIAPASASADPPAAGTPVVVAAIGDSLTDARSRGGLFLELLRQRCPQSRFDNYGVGGQMVSQMRRRFLRDVFGPGKPAYTHVIVFGGVNDLYSDATAGRTPALIERDLAFMYEEARRHSARVVAVTVAPWGGFTRYFNASRAATTLEVNRWILAQRGGAVDFAVDAYGLLACGESLCAAFAAPFRDGLHFGPAGHERLGEAMFEQVFANCA